VQVDIGVPIQELGDLLGFVRRLDLLRKSGEFPVSNEELDETATTVYKGI
jgi:hypothetical protein